MVKHNLFQDLVNVSSYCLSDFQNMDCSDIVAFKIDNKPFVNINFVMIVIVSSTFEFPLNSSNSLSW